MIGLLRKVFFQKNEDIEKLFLNNKLPSNLITNQFSGIGNFNYNTKNAVNLSLSNLANIDMIIELKDIFKFLNFFISLYDLPNLFFQNQQIRLKKKIRFLKKKINLIKKYNKLDIKII